MNHFSSIPPLLDRGWSILLLGGVGVEKKVGKFQDLFKGKGGGKKNHWTVSFWRGIRKRSYGKGVISKFLSIWRSSGGQIFFNHVEEINSKIPSTFSWKIKWKIDDNEYISGKGAIQIYLGRDYLFYRQTGEEFF